MKTRFKCKKYGGSDIDWSNPCEDQTTHFSGCTKSYKAVNSSCNCKKSVTTYEVGPTILFFLFLFHFDVYKIVMCVILIFLSNTQWNKMCGWFVVDILLNVPMHLMENNDLSGSGILQYSND